MVSVRCFVDLSVLFVCLVILLDQVSSFSAANALHHLSSFSFSSCSKQPQQQQYHPTCKSRFVCSLFGSPNDNNENQDDDMVDDSVDGANNNDDDIPNVPLPQAPKYMTAMEQSYREAELELLADLRYGDDMIPKFRELWYSERGEQMEEIMHRAWEGLGHPDYWPTAEKTLLGVIQDDPTYLHPFVLLSKLYCLQGKFQESQVICQHILELKPYHFVAIETMVANCVAQQQVKQARYWEAKRLPQPSRKNQRWEWVKRAIEDATRLLEEARESNLPGSGDEEGIIEQDGKTDAWQ